MQSPKNSPLNQKITLNYETKTSLKTELEKLQKQYRIKTKGEFYTLFSEDINNTRSNQKANTKMTQITNNTPSKRIRHRELLLYESLKANADELSGLDLPTIQFAINHDISLLLEAPEDSGLSTTKVAEKTHQTIFVNETKKTPKIHSPKSRTATKGMAIPQPTKTSHFFPKFLENPTTFKTFDFDLPTFDETDESLTFQNPPNPSFGLTFSPEQNLETPIDGAIIFHKIAQIARQLSLLIKFEVNHTLADVDGNSIPSLVNESQDLQNKVKAFQTQLLAEFKSLPNKIKSSQYLQDLLGRTEQTIHEFFTSIEIEPLSSTKTEYTNLDTITAISFGYLMSELKKLRDMIAALCEPKNHNHPQNKFNLHATADLNIRWNNAQTPRPKEQFRYPVIDEFSFNSTELKAIISDILKRLISELPTLAKNEIYHLMKLFDTTLYQCLNQNCSKDPNFTTEGVISLESLDQFIAALRQSFESFMSEIIKHHKNDPNSIISEPWIYPLENYLKIFDNFLRLKYVIELKKFTAQKNLTQIAKEFTTAAKSHHPENPSIQTFDDILSHHWHCIAYVYNFYRGQNV